MAECSTDQVQSYHNALSALSSAYRMYADVKLRGYEQTSGGSAPYTRPAVTLGSAVEYAAHYTQYVVPLLIQNLAPAAAPSPSERAGRFLDMGCAPGGLCRCLIQHWPRSVENNGAPASWTGVGVTLAPEAGGLPMEFKHDRLAVRFADVCDSEDFIEKSVLESERRTYDFVNLGIVLDARVKSRISTTRVVGYRAQLHTQLKVAQRALTPGAGCMMVAMKLDYPSLPEIIRTMALFSDVAETLVVVPTLYTRCAGRKQFYLFAGKCAALTDAWCDSVRAVWEEGKLRYHQHVERVFAAKRQREAADTTVPSDEHGEPSASVEAQKPGSDPPCHASTSSHNAPAPPSSSIEQQVASVYMKVGSSFDTFCDMVRDFLEKGASSS